MEGLAAIASCLARVTVPNTLLGTHGIPPRFDCWLKTSTISSSLGALIADLSRRALASRISKARAQRELVISGCLQPVLGANVRPRCQNAQRISAGKEWHSTRFPYWQMRRPIGKTRHHQPFITVALTDACNATLTVVSFTKQPCYQTLSDLLVLQDTGGMTCVPQSNLGVRGTSAQ